MPHVEIPLSRGLVARVSEADADRIAPHRWHAVKAGHTFYAARRTSERGIYMHRQVLGVVGLGRDVFVDHINHDGLDNTRENLRPCTHAENNRNRRDRLGAAPAWAVYPVGEKWEAKISVAGGSMQIGRYASEREALIAYAAAEKAILTMIRRTAQ